MLVGERIWQLVGSLSPKDKTQLEERLRRVAGPSSPDKGDGPMSPTSRLAAAGVGARSASPAPGIASRLGALPRSASPAGVPTSRLARPISPSNPARSLSPSPSAVPHPASPARTSKIAKPTSHLPGPSSPSGIGRPKSLLPSRLGPPRSRPKTLQNAYAAPVPEERVVEERYPEDDFSLPASVSGNSNHTHAAQPESDSSEDITVAISSILSNDPSRSVDALKRIQKVLEIGPEEGPSSPAYRELAEHTEGLIETITLQMAHVFERPEDVSINENFRLAKHLIQTLNAFCDHIFLAESSTLR